MKKFFGEFKTFISRGNVFDMAVGIIIASAFNKIVSSLVNDIIMPLVTWSTGAASLKDLSLPLRTSINPITGLEEVTLRFAYGAFLQTVIDFLIIAFSVFIMVKLVNSSHKNFVKFKDYAIKQTRKDVIEEKRKIRSLSKEKNIKFKILWKEHLKEKSQKEAKLKAEKEAQLAKKIEEENLKNPTQEMLLKEIRDLLKEKNNK